MPQPFLQFVESDSEEAKGFCDRNRRYETTWLHGCRKPSVHPREHHALFPPTESLDQLDPTGIRRHGENGR